MSNHKNNSIKSVLASLHAVERRAKEIADGMAFAGYFAHGINEHICSFCLFSLTLETIRLMHQHEISCLTTIETDAITEEKLIVHRIQKIQK